MADNDLYLGLGIDQDRCAACAAYPELPCAVHREIPAPTYAPVEDPIGRPSTDLVNRVANAMIAEWERVEGKKVSVSYVATFADMARAAIVEVEKTRLEIQ